MLENIQLKLIFRRNWEEKSNRVTLWASVNT